MKNRLVPELSYDSYVRIAESLAEARTLDGRRLRLPGRLIFKKSFYESSPIRLPLSEGFNVVQSKVLD